MLILTLISNSNFAQSTVKTNNDSLNFEYATLIVNSFNISIIYDDGQMEVLDFEKSMGRKRASKLLNNSVYSQSIIIDRQQHNILQFRMFAIKYLHKKGYDFVIPIMREMPVGQEYLFRRRKVNKM